MTSGAIPAIAARTGGDQDAQADRSRHRDEERQVGILPGQGRGLDEGVAEAELGGHAQEQQDQGGGGGDAEIAGVQEPGQDREGGQGQQPAAPVLGQGPEQSVQGRPVEPGLGVLHGASIRARTRSRAARVMGAVPNGSKSTR